MGNINQCAEEAKLNNSKTMRGFLDEVRDHSLRSAGRDFGNDQQAGDIALAVPGYRKIM